MATMYPQVWERPLLSLAYEAEQQDAALAAPLMSDQDTLEHAYAYCDAITAIHSRTFSTATRLLPLEKRQAMRALYAFCRRSDDIIDCSASSQAETQARLSAWRQTALSAQPPADDPVALAWADTRVRTRSPCGTPNSFLTG